MCLLLISGCVCIVDVVHKSPLDCLTQFKFPCFKAMEKLKRQLAEAEAALEARKKPPEDTGPRIVGEGLVIDEWVRN